MERKNCKNGRAEPVEVREPARAVPIHSDAGEGHAEVNKLSTVRSARRARRAHLDDLARYSVERVRCQGLSSAAYFLSPESSLLRVCLS